MAEYSVQYYLNGGEREYYSFNVHGDTAALFDAAGTITKNYDYDAFGNQTTAQENDNNPFRYCGEYFDNETNFIYLRARYYNSETGRFTTEDPAKDGVNWYIYCGNNPVNFRDPTGNWAEDGSDSRFKDNNPVVYRAIEDLSNTWIKLDWTIVNKIDRKRERLRGKHLLKSQFFFVGRQVSI
ncbi:RHS repeat-associated core domain-containing protein [Acetivibrio sp. MSJd-27]|uniref:RHS repeat-associated core domain-containing protein n=1 Tax=Acetivibrio sp. MSJd-27 TaxID=2841523 RepID=UPI001C10795B|nr:RHS repeat-associated core domain-containing protein [Acetivibrio sp. MSJd-27]MBU5451381.1 RHS repeat-associated core domain-containing protein [Acetivibrio sp. MSJd-27]